MRRRGDVRSLGQRLSYHLALLTFLGLALVSTAVYLATALHVDQRQADQLAQYEKVVTHLAQEPSPTKETDTFRHKLGDLFGDRTDISLTLHDPQGLALYSSRSAVEGAKRTHRFTLASDDGSGTITATLSLATEGDDQLLQHLAITLIVAALAGASVASVGSFFLVRRGLSPVGDLVRQIKTMPTNRFQAQLDGSRQPVELQPLVEQFNALLLNLDQAYEQQKGFSADVAHELRTPLATMTANSELALFGAGDSHSLRDSIESNLEELDRMTTIVSDMLFLAQADRGEEARRTQTTSLLDEFRDVLTYYEEPLEEAALKVDTEGDAAGHYDVSLLKRALSNLLENAMRHATKDSVILLRLSCNATETIIEVENSGDPIGSRQLERIFQRFYRVSDQPAGDRRHHGLGLSIVAAIARMHGGSPYASSSAASTRIGIRLPTRSNH